MFALFAFLAGLLCGSLLNVCIVRLPRGESIVKPRSHCMACGHLVRWYDNIPILSWVFLRGRCRDCTAGIPWRYPLVELAMGIWFAILSGRIWVLVTSNWMTVDFGPPLAVWRADRAIDLISLAILGFLLIGLMVMDWQTHRLPDAFTLTGAAAGFFLACTQAIFLNPGEGQILLPAEHMRLRSPGVGTIEGNVFLTGPEALVFGRLAATVGAALLLLAIRWAYRAIRHRDGLGLGDVKMLAMIAAFLGFSESLLALLVGVLAASLYGLTLIARRKAHAATALPFGSFLAVGGLFAALWGSSVVDWYARMLR
jgi:leader peptidase (prepilin peptidase)/N-methyltransferase